MNNQAPLSGHRFLIVEDQAMQACHLGVLLTEMGGTVARIAYGFEQAQSAIYAADFDCAILDINLAGTLSFPLIDLLEDRGIPVVICTAYADAVEVYPGAESTPRLDKPINTIELRDTVLQVLHPGSRRRRRAASGGASGGNG